MPDSVIALGKTPDPIPDSGMALGKSPDPSPEIGMALGKTPDPLSDSGKGSGEFPRRLKSGVWEKVEHYNAASLYPSPLSNTSHPKRSESNKNPVSTISIADLVDPLLFWDLAC
jgi:hypothetical protein